MQTFYSDGREFNGSPIKDVLQTAVERANQRMVTVSTERVQHLTSLNEYTPPENFVPSPELTALAYHSGVLQDRENQASNAFMSNGEAGTVLGQTKQLGAQVVDTVTGAVTGYGSFLTNRVADGIQNPVPRDIQEAYIRDKNANSPSAGTAVNFLKSQSAALDAKLIRNEIGGEEYAVAKEKLNKELSQFTPLTKAEQDALDKPGVIDSESYRQRMQRAETVKQFANDMEAHQKETFGSLVNQTATSDLAKEVAHDWNTQGNKEIIKGGFKKLSEGKLLEGADDVIEGSWDTLGDVKDALVHNPAGIVDSAGQAASQAIGYLRGKGIGTVINVGFSVNDASTTLTQGIEDFKKEHGRLPTEEELVGMRAGSVAYGSVDYLSGLIGAKALKKTSDAVGNVEGAAAKSFNVVPTPQEARNSLLGILGDNAKGAAKTAKEVAINTAEETATGATQGLLQETAIKGNYDADKIDSANVFTNAVMEGVGVGSLSAARNALRAPSVTSKFIKDVISTGEDTTPKVTVEGTELKSNLNNDQLKAAAPIVDSAIASGDLSEVVNPQSPTYDPAIALGAIAKRNEQEGVTPEEQRDNVTKAQEVISQLIDEHGAISDKIEELKQQPDYENNPEVNVLLDKADALAEIITPAFEALNSMKSKYGRKAADTEQAINDLADPDVSPETKQSTVEDIIQTANLTPEHVGEEVINKLAESQDISEEHRKYFAQMGTTNNAMDDYRSGLVGKASIEEVTKDILTDTVGSRSIPRFRKELTAALSTSNFGRAGSVMSAFTEFAASKIQRAQDFKNALDKLSDPTLSRQQKLAVQKEFDALGYTTASGTPYFINPKSANSVGMINAMVLEARALASAVAEGSALIRTRGNKTTQLQNLNSSVDTLVKPVMGATVVADVVNGKPTTPQPTIQTTKAKPVNTNKVSASSTNVTPATVSPSGNTSTGVTEPVFDNTEIDNSDEGNVTLDEYEAFMAQQEASDAPPNDRVEQPNAPTEVSASVGETQTSDVSAATDTTETGSNSENAPTTETSSEKPGSTIDPNYSLSRELFNNASGKVKKGWLVVKSITNKTPTAVDKVQGLLNRISEAVSGKQSLDFIKPYLKKDTPEKETKELLASLASFHNTLHKQGGVFDSLYDPSDDYLGLLSDSDGKVSEQVRFAISVVMYNWLATQAKGTLYNNPSAINSLAFRDKNAPYNPALTNLLIDKGITTAALAETLGSDLARNLGIGFSKKTASGAEQPKFEIALGGLMVNLLGGMRYIGIQLLSNKEIEAALGNEEFVGNTDVAGRFMARALTNPKEKNSFDLHPAIQKIVELSAAAPGVLTSLYTPEKETQGALLEPAKKVNTVMRKTRQNLPRAIAKLIHRAQQIEFNFIPESLAVLDKLDEDTVNRIFGFTKDIDKTTHKVDMKSAEARNAAALRSLEHFKDLRQQLVNSGKGESGGFFFKYFVAKQTRLHIDSNGFNPQGDKNHRHLTQATNWKAPISTDENSVSNAMFRLGIAQAFDQYSDNYTREESLEKLTNFLEENPIVGEVADMVTNLDSVQDDKEFQTKLVEVLDLLKKVTPTHVIQGLSALGQLRKASANGDTSFEGSIPVELDGKTNGPAIGLLQMVGTSAKELPELMKQFGLYADGTQSFAEWASKKGSNDAYQTMAMLWDKALTDVMSSHTRPNANAGDARALSIIASFKHFMGDLTIQEDVDEDGGEALTLVTSDGRTMGKIPTLTSIYGAGKASILSNIVQELLKTVRKDLVSAANFTDDTMSEQELFNARMERIRSIEKHLDTIVGSRGSLNINKPHQALTQWLNSKQEKAVLHAFSSGAMGESLKVAIDTRYVSFQEKRNTIQQSLEVVNTIFIKLFNEAINNRISEITNPEHKDYNPEFDTTKHTLPVAEVQAIEDSLVDVMPIVRAYHGTEREGAKAGIYLGNKDRVRNMDERFTIKLKFNGKVPFVNHKGEIKQAYNLVTFRAPQEEYSEVGLGGMIKMIHSLDAAIAYEMQAAAHTISVFDGFVVGTERATEAGKAVNNAFYKISKDYSIAGEVLNTLNRAVSYVQKQPNSQALEKSIRETLTDKFQKQHKGDLSNYVAELKHLVDVTDKAKKEYLDTVHTVSQYVLFDGEATVGTVPAVTEKQPTTPKLGDKVDPESLNKLREAIKNKPEQETVTEEFTQLKEIVENETKSVSPWGAVGTDHSFIEGAGLYANEDLVNYFEETSAPNITEALDVLVNSLDKSEKNHDKYLAGLAKELKTKMDKDKVGITVLKPNDTIDNPEDAAWFGKHQPLAAFIPGKDGKGHIYLKSTAFKEHGMSASTLLHEVLHAALFNVLAQDNVSPEVKKAKAYLDDLRKEIIKDLQASGDITISKEGVVTSKKFANALQNLDEFISWGMTHRPFQKYLHKTKGKGKDPFIFFHRFAQALRKLLGLSTDVDDTALAQVINTTSMLLDEVSTNKTTLTQRFAQAGFNQAEVTNEDLFDSIGDRSTRKVDAKEQSRLKDILKQIGKQIPIYEHAVQTARQSVNDATDLYLQRLVGNKNPFTSRLHSLGLTLTNQELYVAEQVELLSRTALATDLGLRTELRSIFSYAKTALPLSVFSTDPSIDLNDPANARFRRAAEARRRAVFNVEITSRNSSTSDTSSTGVTESAQSDYLARFLALGLVHKPFRDALGKLNRRDIKGNNNLSTRVRELFNAVMDTIHWLLAKQSDERKVDSRISEMFENIADARIRENNIRLHALNKQADKLSDAFDSGVKAVKAKISKVAKSPYIANHKSPFVRAGGMAVTVYTDGLVDEFIEAATEVADNAFKGKHSIVGDIINEMKGPTKKTQPFYELLRKAKNLIDQKRMEVAEYTKHSIDAAFGRKLTEAESFAATRVGIRTDLSSLLKYPGHTIASIDTLLRNPNALHSQIDSLRRDIKRIGGSYAHHFIQDARDLGYYMASGKSGSAHLLRNAHNIANQVGRGTAVSKDVADKIKPLVDQLATLWAINYTPESHKVIFSELLRSERTRQAETGANGVLFLLNMHKKLVEKAEKELFDGNPIQMIKGYTKDTYDSHTSIRAVDTADNFGIGGELINKDLLSRGYEKVSDLGLDHNINGTQRTLILSKGDSLLGYLTGILSLTSRKAKGSNGLEFNDRIGVRAANAKKINQVSNRGKVERDPSLVRELHTVPVFSSAGKVTAYNYLMENDIRDSLLLRDNSLNTVMGNMASSIVDKVNSVKVNRQTVEMLYEDFKNNQNSKGRFIAVGKNSTDKELAERYALLPEETKKAIRDVFGGDTMYVRKELLNMVTGYRKVGLSGIWDIPEYERSEFQKLFVSIIEHTPGLDKKTLMKLRVAGEIWDTLIKEVKDIWVIRNVLTPLSNIVSNMSILYLMGVPMVDMIKNHREGYNGILQYQADSKELAVLQNQINFSTGLHQQQRQGVLSRIAELEDSISNNPVKALVEAGVFQTIVEDLDTVEDPNSYRSRFTKMVDEVTANVPQPVKDAASVIGIGRDSTLYKFLNQTTQVSDFVARYALFKHLTKEGENAMSERDAMNKVMNMFVMYDVPTNKYIQYLNDKGFLMFTKYYLRMQKIIFEMVTQRPARALMITLTNGVFDWWDVTESSMFNHGLLSKVSNPLNSILEAPEDIATFALMGKVF